MPGLLEEVAGTERGEDKKTKTPAADGDEPPTKKGGGKTGEGGSSGKKKVDGIKKNDELKQPMTLVLKTQLRGEQRFREVEGVVFDTYVGPADSLFLNQLTQQTQSYSAKVKGNKGHGFGPPHVYAFLGFLEGLVKGHKEEVRGRNLETLTKYKTEYQEATWQEVADQILAFKLTKVYDRDKRRLTMSISPTLPDLRKCIAGCMDQIKWERKYGRAPPSHMERELQAFLEALTK